MKTKIILFLVLVIVLFFATRPKQTESVEYYETKDPSFSGENTVVTPDQMDQMIKLTQPEVSKQLGKCTYCINTDTVQLVGNTYYVRFMFMVLTGFPYGVGVDAVIAADKDKDPQKLISINLQSINTIDDGAIDKFDQFQQASDFSADSLPTLSQLQAVLNKQ